MIQIFQFFLLPLYYYNVYNNICQFCNFFFNTYCFLCCVILNDLHDIKFLDNSDNIDGTYNFITPTKNQSLLSTTIEKKHISSPIGTWTVEEVNDAKLLCSTSSDGNNLQVKKVLFSDKNTENPGNTLN